MKKIRTTIIHTQEAYDIIAAKAEAAHPGWGINDFINSELRKEVLRVKDICIPCQFIEVVKIKREYVVPENLSEAVICLCERWGVSASGLVSRIAIEPHLLGK